MTTETEGAAEAVTEHTDAPETDAEDTTPAQGDEQSGDDAAAASDEGQGEPPKPKKSAQERINELTRKAREAERDAEYWKSKAIQSPEARQEKEPEPQGDGRPDPAAYDYGVSDERYIEDLTEWKAAQVVERTLTAREQNQRAMSALETFNKRVAEQFPDGEPDGIAALRRAPKVESAITDVVMASEIGPKMADYLGANPSELARLSALPPPLIGRELGKLEARLETPPAPKAKTATDAPEPPPQARGVGGRFTVPPDTNDFSAFEKQYGG